MKAKKSENFHEWYPEVILSSKLADYAPVHGCMVIRERGYAIWERMQADLDARIKAMGVKNAYFPLFIPESLLKKEAEHFKGFVPEVAWVEKKEGDGEERVALRPTSETIIYHMYSKWIRSHRDLPLKLNNWCNIVRWEIKQTRLFLRTREFLWQEGHTAHATPEEAEKQVADALDAYADFSEKVLAIPVLKGKKTRLETFAGAVYTTSIESLMPDGRALQMGTSHYFGDHFPKMFGIKYMSEADGTEKFAHTTSWGVSTRLIGAVVMVHGDDKGLILPPAIAPEQAVIVPVFREDSKEKVIGKCEEIRKRLEKAGVRCIADYDENHTPGWKFAEYELYGIPLRIEIGPKDIEKKQAMIARRDTGEKAGVAEAQLEEKVGELLKEIQTNLFQRAKKFLDENTITVKTYSELKTAIAGRKMAKAAHCGNEACEQKIKDETEGGSIRCIPLKQEKISDKCAACGLPAKYTVLIAKAY